MKTSKYKVGIIGCGKIFIRHYESIMSNSDFELVAVCDIDDEKLRDVCNMYNLKGYYDYKKMVTETSINFVVVATPNSLHTSQAIFCLSNGCDVLIEKPATLDPSEINLISDTAASFNKKAYCVLQVRLNPEIQVLKKLLDNKELGKIRGVNLIQRWQRPISYFYDWRGTALVGGGTLHECGIHYIDILCYLFGKPQVVSSKTYNTKHFGISIEDTTYSILDYGDYGGNLEVTISSEPTNLECSISLMTDQGYIKIGGKALNEVKEVKFLSQKLEAQVKSEFDKMTDKIDPNSYGQYAGSCPNHPELYKNLDCFDLNQTYNVLKLIDEIYECCDRKYYTKS